MECLSTVILFCSALFLLITNSSAVDTISANQTIRDGDTIVSADEIYELGFFNSGSSRNRYLGIWYNNISPRTVVWVANRETPITNASGVFRVTNEGSLLVLGDNSTVVWSSNSSVAGRTINPVAQLLNTGNLVVRNERSTDPENFIWQSFDYPGDTFLPGMKYGKDFVTGRDRQWTSSKSPDDPSPGEYVSFMDTNGFPQLFEMQGSRPHSRFGPWNGITFNGMPALGPNSIFTHQFVFNQEEVYYGYELVNSSVLTRVYLSPDGNTLRLNWVDRTQTWFLYWSTIIDICSPYGVCGPYGSCNVNNAPVCSCMEGFEPRNPGEWNGADWSSGCQRRTPVDCGNGDGFRVFKNVKLPDTRSSWYDTSMTLAECEMACRRNCSCTAYSNLDIRNNGSGCLLWFGDLMDVRTVDESQDLYVRLAASELTGLTVPESRSNSGSNKNRQKIIVAVSISVSLLLVGLTLLVYFWSKKKRSLLETEGTPVQTRDEEYSIESPKEDTDLSSFSLSMIAKSTNDFSNGNKLGEGGFGPVYKGVLDGKEIAVKRLSKTSRQGLDEFKNEARFIAKLQHRNLVKLLGYFIQEDETILIYEYMPNRSLDSFIFDKTKSFMLDWPQRFRIIHGIARGLLYLHHDSRLKIVHRDLKASNILLDKDMTPKISDFGLARMFKEHENEANTQRVVGTLGYISPEYAVDGLFSVKSDVFSFGVLVLEIVSGKKNRGFSRDKDSDNLLGHAWRLHEEGKDIELLDSTLRESCVESEVLRSIHIGLLCVQHHAQDRPTMSSVVLMFGKDGELPPPKQPAFFAEGSLPEFNYISVNGLTLTALEAR